MSWIEWKPSLGSKALPYDKTFGAELMKAVTQMKGLILEGKLKNS